MDNNIDAIQYLKKGRGKLGSQNHGITDFVKKRRQKIMLEQLARENTVNIISV
jgi:hypothetical protein